MATKWDIEKVKEFALKNGGCTVIDTIYIKNSVPMNFICKCGNRFTTTWNKYVGRNQRQCKVCGHKIVEEYCRLTLAEIQNRISKFCNTIVLTHEYKNGKQLLDCQCECGVIFQRSYANMQKRNQYRCDDCDNRRVLNWDKINKFILENSNSILLPQEYINVNQLLKIKCSCGEIFERKWTVLRQFNGFVCEKCSGIIVWNLEKVIDWTNINTTAKFLSNEYTGYEDKYSFLCECGEIFSCSWHNFYKVHQHNCKKCSSSKGEIIIRNYLENKNTPYTYEQKFSDLKGVGNGYLSYDFALNGTPYLIEFQGQYHDGTANNQTEEEFIIQQQNDDIKRKYAENNRYDLIEIWYWDIDKIEQILDRTFCNNNLQSV